MSNRAAIHRNITRPGRYSTGKRAVGIDHRSGFKVLLKDLKYEPGTNYLVTEDENDGEYNLVTDPLNFPPQKKTERVALRWAFFDVPLSIGTVVSADNLYLPSYASVSGQFIQYAQIYSLVSIGDGASSPYVPGLNFTSPLNSQYYVLIFQGI